MASSDDWVPVPNRAGVWERRLRCLWLPLTQIAVVEDMGVLVWGSKESPDPKEFDTFSCLFTEYRFLRAFS